MQLVWKVLLGESLHVIVLAWVVILMQIILSQHHLMRR